MINDRGTVVFDAILNTADSTAIQALLVWQEQSGAMSVAVKTADENGHFGDTYKGQTIWSLVPDLSTDFAGDVLKDGLSDDNWLAFGISYGDNFDPGVVSVFIPEPASLSLLLGMGGVAMLRRRRRR